MIVFDVNLKFLGRPYSTFINLSGLLHLSIKFIISKIFHFLWNEIPLRVLFSTCVEFERYYYFEFDQISGISTTPIMPGFF